MFYQQLYFFFGKLLILLLCPLLLGIFTLLICKSSLYVTNFNPSSMVHFFLSLHLPFNLKVRFDQQIFKTVGILMV